MIEKRLQILTNCAEVASAKKENAVGRSLREQTNPCRHIADVEHLVAVLAASQNWGRLATSYTVKEKGKGADTTRTEKCLRSDDGGRETFPAKLRDHTFSLDAGSAVQVEA